MIAGVCNGLAAYFQVDVTVIRIVFVVLRYSSPRAPGSSPTW